KAMKGPRRTKEKNAQKYLKPGALAQMRDAKRSARSVPSSCLPAAQGNRTRDLINTDQEEVERVPCFSNRTFGPAYPQRKKLLAQKNVLLVAAQYPTDEEMDVSTMPTETEALNNTLLAVH
ncbi:hypothetical protein KI387_003864, partial [Taxus chinensis]